MNEFERDDEIDEHRKVVHKVESFDEIAEALGKKQFDDMDDYLRYAEWIQKKKEKKMKKKMASDTSMTKSSDVVDQHETLMAPQFAAEYFASQLGETSKLWTHRLANWRRPGRKSPIKHETTDAGEPVYTVAALNEFVATRQTMRTMLTATQQPRAGATAHLDGPDDPHIRVMFATGSTTRCVFELDAPAARRLAEMLVKSADLVDRVAGHRDGTA